MPRTLKAFKSTVGLVIGFLFITSFSLAQESSAYYRYFEINLDESIDHSEELKSNLFGEKPFEIHSSCSMRNSILVSVSADYPKRVHQIEEELKKSLKAIISKDKTEVIRPIKALDLESFCQ